MQQPDPRYVVLLAHDFISSRHVVIKKRHGVEEIPTPPFGFDEGNIIFPDEKNKSILTIKKRSKVQVVFAPGQIRLYLLTERNGGDPHDEGTESYKKKDITSFPPPPFRLILKSRLPSNVLIRVVFESEQAIVFYSPGTQKRVIRWYLERNEIAEAIVVCERLIKFRAYSGLLTEKEMGQDYETYQKILAMALGTNFEDERKVALRMALKKALVLAGCWKEMA